MCSHISKLNINSIHICNVNNCSKIMLELKNQKFTYLIMNISQSDGNSLEIIPNIRNLYSSLKILVYSLQPLDIYIKQLKRYNIHHLIHNNSNEDETILVLYNFMNNIIPVNFSNKKEDVAVFMNITKRELEILHYLLKDVGTNEMAGILNLKSNTISTYKKRIVDKTGSKNIKEVLQKAHFHKLI